MRQSRGQYLVLHIQQSIISTSFNMSKAEHAGPRRNAGEGKQMMSIRHHPVCLCVRLCLHTFLCAYERLHVYLICFQEHLIRDFEMQVSTRRKVCLFGHRRMFSSMLPGTLNDSPPPFFSQWEILGGAKQLQTYKPKGPEIRQDVTSS